MLRPRLPLLAVLTLALGGCSSPSRGPEIDVVEVERIEVAPAPAGGEEIALPTGQ